MGHLRGPTCIRRALWRAALGLLACILGAGPAMADEVMLHARGKPFADKRVATALQIAIDWPAAFKEAGLPADSVARIRVVDLGLELTPRRYDPKTALRLLAEAGYSNGLQAPLDAPRDAYALARAVAQSLGRVKIAAPVSLRADTGSTSGRPTIDPQLLNRLLQGAQRLRTPPGSTAPAPAASLSLSVRAQAPRPETTPPETVPAELMPRLIGLDLEAARRLAEDRKLTVAVGGSVASQAPANTVVDQTPKPGVAVPRTRQAFVVLSTGPAPPTEWCVPNLLTLTVAQAERRLAEARLKLEVRAIGREHSSLPPGSIISQRPGPEDCRTQPLRPPRIEVVLSLGPALIVPELVGLTPDQARARYPKPPLNLRVAGEREAGAARGTIVDQAPTPGATMTAGDEIAVWLSRGPRPRVPDLIGLTPKAAEAEHRDLGLRVEPTGAEHDPVDAGTIIRQRPAAGAVLPDPPIIAVVLSRGSRPTVPNLVGLTPDAAEAAHRDLALRVEALDERHDDADAGTIIRQRPAAGAPLPEPPTIAVVLSRGSRPTVPDLVGLTPATAEAEHRGLALRVAPAGAEHDPADAGTIIRQRPAAGAPLPDPPIIAVVLSRGSRPTVPDLAGLTPEAAEAEHRDLALRVETTDTEHDDADAGTIIRQRPAAGAPLPEPPTIAVVLSRGPQPTVPDLVGLTPDAAEAEHRDLALALDRRGAEPDPAEAGLIIRQDPAAGSPLPEDRRVAFWLSLGPSLAVPDIVGLTPDAARDRHRVLALVVETIDETHRRAQKGTIVSQFPAAGAPLPADRRVAAVLSLGPDYVSIGGWTAGALTLLGTLVFAVRHAGRRSGRPKDADAALDASAPQVRFNREYGEQEIESADGALAGPAMGLRVRVDAGRQGIDGLDTIDRR